MTLSVPSRLAASTSRSMLPNPSRRLAARGFTGLGRSSLGGWDEHAAEHTATAARTVTAMRTGMVTQRIVGAVSPQVEEARGGITEPALTRSPSRPRFPHGSPTAVRRAGLRATGRRPARSRRHPTDDIPAHALGELPEGPASRPPRAGMPGSPARPRTAGGDRGRPPPRAPGFPPMPGGARCRPRIARPGPGSRRARRTLPPAEVGNMGFRACPESPPRSPHAGAHRIPGAVVKDLRRARKDPYCSGMQQGRAILGLADRGRVAPGPRRSPR